MKDENCPWPASRNACSTAGVYLPHGRPPSLFQILQKVPNSTCSLYLFALSNRMDSGPFKYIVSVDGFYLVVKSTVTSPKLYSVVFSTLNSAYFYQPVVLPQTISPHLRFCVAHFLFSRIWVNYIGFTRSINDLKIRHTSKKHHLLYISSVILAFGWILRMEFKIVFCYFRKKGARVKVYWWLSAVLKEVGFFPTLVLGLPTSFPLQMNFA